MMTMSRGICLHPAAIVFDQSPQLLVSVQTWSQDPCLNVKICPNVSFGKVDCKLYTVYCEKLSVYCILATANLVFELAITCSSLATPVQPQI